MSGYQNSPKIIKGGLILIDPVTGNVQRVIALQYNPDSLSRTLQPQSTTGSAAFSEPLRLKGPPLETIKLEAEIDATDQLEFPDSHSTAVQVGIHPQIAALETIIYPDSGTLIRNNQMAGAGTLEIVPVAAPLPLFVWSAQRVVPVRITDFSVIEEAFDTRLNPIRARVSLGMRVLNVNDLGFADRGGNVFMVYQQQRERLSVKATGAALGALGLNAVP
jgi:hypothetical protein